MIQDKIRTSTYAQFIMTNPILFKDAIVLDVGCGTGILSLFAAKSGAKHVIAVDASDIAEKAIKIVKANGLDEIITYVPFVLIRSNPKVLLCSVSFAEKSKI